MQENPDFKAALDVYEKEPDMAEGLKECDNAVIVPHIASATLWTRGGMSVLAALNVRGILENYPICN